MNALARITIAVAVLLMASAGARSQALTKESNGSISGRITLGGQGLPGVVVGAQSGEPVPIRPTAPMVKATTDQDGRYRLTGLAAGRYSVAPAAPVYVVKGETRPGLPGKTVTLAEGEALEGIDFTLTRGAVITGKVTDADGRPVIGERVTLTSFDEQGRRRPLPPVFNPYMNEIDDRGIYRVYGLPAGRYTVSVGVGSESGVVRVGSGSGYYQRTFHPNVTEEAKATVVEVSEGTEATNIDITLGRPTKTFEVTGRIISAETGQPVPNVAFGYGSLRDGQNLGSIAMSGNRTNALGEFRVEGVMPGRYAAFVLSEAESDFYGDPVTFEVTSGDVSGLEIPLRRGATIHGVIAVEGTNDPALLSKVSQLSIGASPTVRELSAPRMLSQSRINPDGSFRLTGLRPGKVRISVSAFQGPKGFSFLRTERDGVEQREIEVGPGEQVTGVRVVIAYGNGVIRGQVKIVGALAEGTRMMVSALRHSGGSTPVPVPSMGGEVDARGHFMIDGLAAGEYELTLNVMAPFIPGAPPQRPRPPVKQMVTVTNGAESQVTFTLDLTAREKEDKQ